jgi:hypothetical protein
MTGVFTAEYAESAEDLGLYDLTSIEGLVIPSGNARNLLLQKVEKQQIPRATNRRSE